MYHCLVRGVKRHVHTVRLKCAPVVIPLDQPERMIGMYRIRQLVTANQTGLNCQLELPVLEALQDLRRRSQLEWVPFSVPAEWSCPLLGYAHHEGVNGRCQRRTRCSSPLRLCSAETLEDRSAVGTHMCSVVTTSRLTATGVPKTAVTLFLIRI